MTEKRFTFGPVSPDFAMIKDNGEPMDTEEVVDYLNEQQATIEQQEQSIIILKQEIADTQAILEMLSEKLKGWNNE